MAAATKGEPHDPDHMRAALRLAARALGQVWPNPAVGCVLVRGGRVVGRGWTQPGGRPHAEAEALRRAGATAHGATAYVTLEPCAHHGLTSPCADALLGAGVCRVVGALEDPDPRVAGGGFHRLRDAGVAVTVGLCSAEARALNAGFFSRVERGRPWVTLKLAASLDGRIATATGDSRWITGAPARARAHLLRAEHDGVLVGVGTVIADDPELTCRLPGMERRTPVRIVVDGRLRTPPTARLAAGALTVPTWIITMDGADATRRSALERLGVEVIVVGERGAQLDLGATLRALGGRGLTRVLVEGGSQLATSLLRAGLVDSLAWFAAPRLIGASGIPAVGDLGTAALAEAMPMTCRASVVMDGDRVGFYAVGGDPCLPEL